MIERRLRRIARPLRKSVHVAVQAPGRALARREAIRISRGHGEWEIGRLSTTRGGIHIAPMRSTSGASAILKMTAAPDAARGLSREGTALVRLAAEPQLADVGHLVPRALFVGTSGRWSYLAQEALSGVPATGQLRPSRHRLLPEATDLVARLHLATAVPRVVGDEELGEWLDHPAAMMRGVIGESGRPALERLLSRLRDTLRGQRIALGLVHGDYWLENLLVDPRSGKISGIVDWDSSSQMSLAAHDQLHLILSSRKLLALTHIGDEICRALGTEPGWDGVELPAVALATEGLPGTDAAGRQRLAIALYWLRLVEGNLRRQPRTARSRTWLDRNVRAVLACL